MRQLVFLVLVVLLVSTFSPLLSSAYVFQIPVKKGINSYTAEGLYRVFYLNGSPYFVLTAGSNFTVFKPNGEDYVVGIGFLGIYSTPLGIVTLSKYYVYLNTTPIMESNQGFIGGSASGEYVWAVLSNGSVMVWTPHGGYFTNVYGIPKGPLFFKNYSVFVNGTLEYLPVFHVNGLTFQEYFFGFASVPLGASINLTKVSFYHVFTTYSVPVSFGFIKDKPYFLGYNITNNETVIYYSGELKVFKGLPVLLINYTVPAYLVHLGGSNYSVVFANGTYFSFHLSGRPSVFVANNAIYVHGVTDNSTEVVQVFGEKATFNTSSPLRASISNTSLIVDVLTPSGYRTVLNLTLSTPMRYLGAGYFPTGFWVSYFAYPNSSTIVTVVVTSSTAKAVIPSETYLYPNTRSDPLVYYGFKLPNATAFLFFLPNSTTPGTSSAIHPNLIIYAAIAFIVVIVLVYAGVSVSRRKR